MHDNFWTVASGLAAVAYCVITGGTLVLLALEVREARRATSGRVHKQFRKKVCSVQRSFRGNVDGSNCIVLVGKSLGRYCNSANYFACRSNPVSVNQGSGGSENNAQPRARVSILGWWRCRQSPEQPERRSPYSFHVAINRSSDLGNAPFPVRSAAFAVPNANCFCPGGRR